MFPLIPLLALLAICGGGATLIWYDDLSTDQKKEADRIAYGYAKEIFGKSINELTTAEAKRVELMTQRHFLN